MQFAVGNFLLEIPSVSRQSRCKDGKLHAGVVSLCILNNSLYKRRVRFCSPHFKNVLPWIVLWMMHSCKDLVAANVKKCVGAWTIGMRGRCVYFVTIYMVQSLLSFRRVRKNIRMIFGFINMVLTLYKHRLHGVHTAGIAVFCSV